MGRLGDRGIAAVCGGCLLVAVSFVWLIPGAQNDFVYDWLSASAVVDGLDPYQPIGDLASEQGLASGQELSEIHPRTPGALLLMSPLGWIPYEHSYVFGRLLTVASAVLLALVLAALADVRFAHGLIAVPLLLVVWPFSTVLKYSQAGFLVAALIGLTWLLGDRWAAGLPLAGAVLLKLWPWLLVPALWAVGRRKAATGAGIALVVANLVGLAMPHVTIAGLTRTLADAVTFQSSSVASVLGMPVWLAAVIGLAIVLRFGGRMDNGYGVTVLIALALAPFVWVHYLPALLIPVTLYWRRSDIDSGRPELVEAERLAVA